VLPMRRLRAEYLCKQMHNYYFLQRNHNYGESKVVNIGEYQKVIACILSGLHLL